MLTADKTHFSDQADKGREGSDEREHPQSVVVVS
jgi:hypothetical protein